MGSGGELKILEDTITRTTDGSGNVLLIGNDDKKYILSCYTIELGYAAIPFVYNNIWYAHIIKITGTSNEVVNNTSVTVNFAYAH